MTDHIARGKWHQMTGSLRVKWGELMGDKLDVIAGHGVRLYGILEERYGLLRRNAEAHLARG